MVVQEKAQQESPGEASTLLAGHFLTFPFGDSGRPLSCKQVS